MQPGKTQPGKTVEGKRPRKPEYRFLFRGSALALAGHMRRPQELIIPAQGCSLVPVTGGYAKSEVSSQSYGEFLSFESATTSVEADYQDLDAARKFTFGNYNDRRLPTRTIVTGSLNGVSIVNADENGMRVLSLKQIGATLESIHVSTGREPSIRLLGASIQTLALDGHELEVRFHTELFSRLDTKGQLTQAYESNGSFAAEYGHLFFPPLGSKLTARRARRIPQAGGLIYCTIVESIKWVNEPNPNVRIDGNRIVFQDFGTMYVGELFISDHARRLTMMRLEMGSPWGGECSMFEVESDGQTYPP
jgi:hypothetical protein